MALWEKSGTEKFFLSEHGTGDHSLIPFNTFDKVVNVRTYTLKDLFEIYELKMSLF